MSVTVNDVHNIAHLARIAISDRDQAVMSEQLSSILTLVQKLDEVDTDSILPLAHPLEEKLRLRDDIVTTTNERDDYMSLAPSSEAGLYLVPQVVE